ncbi:MAG TPA: ChaN family lipoprotein [Lentimicrobium sp.]|nr:ChaN family lipoprotein [Lentimicrobium sp.]
MKRILPFILFSFLMMSMDRNIDAYKLFDPKGNEENFRKLVNSCMDADVILFGELHDNPIVHWLQFELSKALYEQTGSKLIMGAEMFEADNALILNEYLQGKVKDKNFEAEARLWPNYKTDYKPLLQFARDSSLRFIATNIPRRYAAIVNKDGFEGLNALNDEAKSYIAPLPVTYDSELSGYKEMLSMMEGSGHENVNLPKAQAIKDATMAYFILKNLTKGDKFIHFNGTYHSDNFQGIMWYLKQARPDLKILTISSVEQDDLSKLSDENKEKADFILVTPASMTKTN